MRLYGSLPILPYQSYVGVLLRRDRFALADWLREQHPHANLQTSIDVLIAETRGGKNFILIFIPLKVLIPFCTIVYTTRL